MESLESKIIGLLESTNRKGMTYLIGDLQESGFFEEIASCRGHSSHKGGLAEHSLNVHEALVGYVDVCKLRTLPPSGGQKPLAFDDNTIIIATLLHDVCKVGAYVRTKADDGWTNKRDKEKGHAILSIQRIKKHIELTEIEEMMIKYHMGVYGLKEFDERSGEYELRNKQMANAWFHNPIVKLMYFCDEIATLREKALEV